MSVATCYEFYLETETGEIFEGLVTADTHKNAIKKVKKDYKRYSIKYVDIQEA